MPSLAIGKAISGLNEVIEVNTLSDQLETLWSNTWYDPVPAVTVAIFDGALKILTSNVFDVPIGTVQPLVEELTLNVAAVVDDNVEVANKVEGAAWS